MIWLAFQVAVEGAVIGAPFIGDELGDDIADIGEADLPVMILKRKVFFLLCSKNVFFKTF